LRSQLADTEFNALWAEGRTLTMEQAIEIAFVENCSSGTPGSEMVNKD
jgi:hypothetical protein